MGGHVAPAVASEGEVAIEMMNSIFGGTFTSRVNMNLREDKGWSYGTRSVISSVKGQRTFMALAPVQSDKTKESLAELKQDELVQESLGEIYEEFVKLKEEEWREYHCQVTKWEIERYLTLF